MYLNHLTLNSAHTARTSRADVTDETIAALAPWLHQAIDYNDPYPTPGPLGADYKVIATRRHGGLACEIVGRAHEPLLTFAVAARARQGRKLWLWLCDQYDQPCDLAEPSAPWCGVVLHHEFGRQRGMSAWVGDFERCVAWTWIARRAIDRLF